MACENKNAAPLSEESPLVDTGHSIPELVQVSSVADPSTKITWTFVDTYR